MLDGSHPLVRRLGKQRYLFASLVAILILQPLLSSDAASPFWRAILLIVIVIAGPLALATRRFDFYLSLVLGVLMVASRWLARYVQADWWLWPGYFATVAFFMMLSVLLFRQQLLGNRQVTKETLVAAVNAYLCIGIMYAFAYHFLVQINPAAFSGDMLSGDRFDACIYLSFVTMTTLGYGDITPNTELAAVLTWTQAVVGQLYVALTVARIVGVMASRHSEVLLREEEIVFEDESDRPKMR